MTDPFRIDGPTCISFSGGRTSAYMLWRVLQSNGGLPDEAVVCFANTGKEDEATLRFVRDCSVNWGVPITWLEYLPVEPRFKVTDFENAARNGEPFEALIRHRGLLPNPVARGCTQELKIRPMGRYLLSLGMVDTGSEGENFSWVGMRADEQRRAAKIEDKSRIPLWAAGVTKEIVGEFWRNHHFDLELPNNNGVTMHGNCDLCFLKPTHQIVSLIAERPERAVWWAKMENMVGSLGRATGDGEFFRRDRPSYSQMLKFTEQQRDMFDPQEEAISCFCGD